LLRFIAKNALALSSHSHYKTYQLQVLIDNYITTNDTSGIFNKLSEVVGLKMEKIQGSDGLMGKRKIAILNIDSILNKTFLSQERSHSACYSKFKIGLYI
jgi:soluble P-type ATPase